MTETVAVLGGGVAGLTAAHELAERGFEVDGLRGARPPRRQGAQPARARLGDRRPRRPAGRARLPLLPRLLPPRARHDAADPVGVGRRDRLVGAERVLLAQGDGRNELLDARRTCRSRSTTSRSSRRFVLEAATALGHPAARDGACFVERLLTLLTSCDERRFGQWEQQSWWDVRRRRAALAGVPQVPRRRAHAHARGRAGARDERAHRRARSCCSCCSTSRARAAAPTACSTGRPATSGSTRGWRTSARSGVDVRLDAPVEGIHDARRAHRRRDASRARRVTARPLRRRACRWRSCARSPGPTLRAAEPRLKRLDRLVTRWMNGVMFYLDRGRAARQRPRHLHRLRVGADLDLPAPVLARRTTSSGSATAASRASSPSTSPTGTRRAAALGKVAMQCTHEEIIDEVWAQLADHLDDARLTARTSCAPVPRPGDRVPQPDRGGQPRAAAGQHRRLLGRPPGGGDAHPEPVPRLRLRAHAHRPGDDGGRQRGGAPRGQRDPRRDRLDRAALRALAAARARRSSRPRARSTASAGSCSSAPAKPPLRVTADGGLEADRAARGRARARRTRWSRRLCGADAERHP